MHPFARGLVVALLLVPALASAQPLQPAAAVAAGRPALALPLACTLGKDCWVANYFDVDASTSVARDFRCHARSYEGHDGTDIAIRDQGEMRRGVPVLAAAAGTVRNIRDAMDDAGVTDPAAVAGLKGRDCGNGVVIDHGGGWQTQYCHLRRGSVRVTPGQVVVAGAPLGLVGLSGRTEFPHLHLTLRLGTMQIDPFTGLPSQQGCGGAAKSLWRADAGIDYEDVALYNAGFSVGPPAIEAIRNGERLEGSVDEAAPALVLWVDIFGVQAGDRLLFSIRDPAGRVVHRSEQSVDRTQARRYAFSGLKRPATGWLPGSYTGEIVHLRQRAGQELMRRVIAVQQVGAKG